MVSRVNTNVISEIDSSKNEKDSVNAAGYRTETHPSRKSRSRENPINDELISSLSNAYENKRARQVSEWERLWHLNVRPAG